VKASVNSANEPSNTGIAIQRSKIFVRGDGVAGRIEHLFNESEHQATAKNFAPTMRNSVATKALPLWCMCCLVPG